MTGSLAYRKNEASILRGDVPPKYTRILPFIIGQRVFEVGSAEGVLALMLAKAGKYVTAVEANTERVMAARRLAAAWGVTEGVTFVDASAGDAAVRAMMDGHDTFVAVRTIYHFRQAIDAIFADVAKRVPRVVLCGNRNRADLWRRGTPHAPLGDFNRYAAREGMRDLLERHGYRISEEVTDGDEIVVGVMD